MTREQPENRITPGPQRIHPNGKDRPAQLVTLVETSQHQRVLGKSMVGPQGSRRKPASPIVDVIAARKAPHVLVKKHLIPRRNHFRIGDDTVDGVIADRSWEAHVMQLQRGRAMREDAESASESVSLAIDQKIDSIVADKTSDFRIWHVAHVSPTIQRRW